MPRDKQINRLSRVVISIKKELFNVYAATIRMALWHLVGGRQALTRFE